MKAPDDPLRIMLVEDDGVTALDLAAMIESTAEAPSIVVCTAGTAAEALIGAREFSPDVAFVDANLRDGLTGPEVAELLGKHFGVFLVMATSEPSDFDGSGADAVYVLPKPFAPAMVRDSLQCVARQIGKGANRRQA